MTDEEVGYVELPTGFGFDEDGFFIRRM